MSDLVDRLRQYGTTDRPEVPGTDSFSLLYEAADEIERLRARVERLRDALLDCSQIDIPFPDTSLPGGDTDFMRGVCKGHEEARRYVQKCVRASLKESESDV